MLKSTLMNKFFEIFITFLKIGMILLGGGYVILPVLQSEIAEKRNWLTNDELCKYFALAQSLPGLIAINTSVFIGYKLAKQKGVIAAVTGIILPAFVTIIIIATLLEQVIHFKFINGIFFGISIGVIMLLYLAVKNMWDKCIVDKFTLIIFFLTFILSICLNLSPSIIIIVMLVTSLYCKRKYFSDNEDCTK